MTSDDVVGVIDCGTNSTRLLIAHSTGFEVLRETRITRLGAGVDRCGQLHPDAIDRTLNVLRQYRKEMDRAGVRRGRMVATSAARDARNGPAFLAAAGKVIGFEPEMLSGDQEGRLAFSGATAFLEPFENEVIVIDIGGGSTELIAKYEGLVNVVSMDLGSVRLTERCLTSDPPTPSEIADARATVENQLERAVASISALTTRDAQPKLLGLAGTVTTLAVLTLDLSEYRRELVHHAVLPLEAVTEWCERLLAEPAATRAVRSGIAPGREDVIAAGALILHLAMSRLGFRECVVSESDILDGLVLTLTAGDARA